MTQHTVPPRRRRRNAASCARSSPVKVDMAIVHERLRAETDQMEAVLSAEASSMGCCCLYRNTEARDYRNKSWHVDGHRLGAVYYSAAISHRVGYVVRASTFFRSRRRLLIAATDSAVSRGVDASVPVRLLVYSQNCSSTSPRELFFTTPRNCLETLYFVSHGGRAPACCCTVGAARWQRV